MLFRWGGNATGASEAAESASRGGKVAELSNELSGPIGRNRRSALFRARIEFRPGGFTAQKGVTVPTAAA
jgi:hypothetical protein